MKGRSPSGKRAREEGGEAGQERGKRRRVEEWGAGRAEGALRPASPRPEADANKLGLGVAAAEAVCAAAGTEGARDGRGVDGGGRGGAGPLCEVGGEDEGGVGEAGDPPLQRPGWQGGDAQGKGASDGGGPMEEDAGRGAPGAGPGLSPGAGQEAQGSDAAGAVAA